MAQTNNPFDVFRTAVIHVWTGEDSGWVLEREPGDVSFIRTGDEPVQALRDHGHHALADHLDQVGFLTMPISVARFADFAG